jgi:F-type H+-transporting ATPase subunit b
MRSIRRRVLRYLLIVSPLVVTAFTAFFLTALPVLAEEGEKQDPADSPTGLIFRWVNFAIVFGIIAFLLVKHGGAFFRSNAKEIASSIREATAAKAEADRELSEVQAKISRIDQEVTGMREAARRNWAAEAERLRASGQAEIQKINQAAHAELDASERAAQHQLRDTAAALSVEQAGALVSAKMNTEVRARLFRSFLDELGRSSN